ncbi:MAG: amidohydrolase family protein [Gemmatimonadota bacterium]|nr:MAG: amidohydrolase family protein [Gemmatimonadota bacterium]
MRRRSVLGDVCRHLGIVVLGVILIVPQSVDAWDASLSSDGSSSIAILAGWIVRPDGTLEKDIAVVVQDGKVRRTCPAKDIQGLPLHKTGQHTVICPGLIDLFSSVGAAGQNVETAKVVDPDASALDAVDPLHKDFRVALQSGITAVMVAPTPNNLVSGTCACVRTFVHEGKLDVLERGSPLVFVLREGVWHEERPPTSRAGAIHMLRAVLADARKGKAHSLVNAVVAGRLKGLIVCRSGQDVAAARGVLGNLARSVAIVHTDDAIDLAVKAGDIHCPVVVGPYTYASSRRVLLGAAALARSKIDVAFRGSFPESPPEALRITAALAVRYGMEPAAARRAMTIAPAKIAGVAGRVGAIAPGRDADLVVFSGDPLRLDKVVLEVYVRGVRVYAAVNQGALSIGERQ